MDEVIQRIPGAEEIMIGRDMNGHICCDRTSYDRVYWGYGFSIKNDAGEKCYLISVQRMIWQ